MPYDGSNYSNNAFYAALEIAVKFESKITIATCLFRSPEEEPFYISEHAKIIDELKNNSMKELNKLQNVAATKKVSVEARIMSCNSVIETLTTFANANKVDLIVMGTRGKTGFKPILLGSVSIGVSQYASCPILLVK